MKRRWRCGDSDCEAKTWTEGSDQVAPRAVLTLRAGAEATRQVGELAMPVAVVARELGVCWWTVMDAVVFHGTPLVDDPKRVGTVRALGIDETSFLSANRERSTALRHGHGGRTGDTPAFDLRRWCAAQDPAWLSVPSGSWPPTWPRAIAPGLPPPRPCHPGGRSLPCGAGAQPVRRQGAPAGPRTRPWVTAAVSTTRSIGSASCSSKGPNGSTSEARSTAARTAPRRPARRAARCLVGQGVGP